MHVDEIDVLVRSTDAPLALPGGEAPPTDVDRAIARHAVAYIRSGATLQTGIGSIPSQIATLLAEGDGGDYGLHSEMFTDGCMQLHRAGKVTNAGKGSYDGVSVTTFAFGSAELYAWLDGNSDVAFLPVEIVNAPDVIGANNDMVTRSTARLRSTSTDRSSPTRSPATSSAGSAAPRTSWRAPGSSCRTAR